MRLVQLLFIVCLLSLKVNGQNITLSQLIELRSQTIGEVEEFLVSKGWEFLEAEEEGFETFGSATFSFQKSSFSRSAESFLVYLYSNKLDIQRIFLQVNNVEKYNEYINAIKSNGNKLIDSKIEDGSIMKIYQGPTTTFKVESSVSSNNYGEDSAIWIIQILTNLDYDIGFSD